MADLLAAMHDSSWADMDHGARVQAVQVQVLGMHCSACSTAVETSLRELVGVQNCSISLLLRKAMVHINPKLVTKVIAHAQPPSSPHT